MERVRIGVIGTGGIVQAVHIPQMLAHGRVDFAWCADTDAGDGSEGCDPGTRSGLRNRLSGAVA